MLSKNVQNIHHGRTMTLNYQKMNMLNETVSKHQKIEKYIEKLEIKSNSKTPKKDNNKSY